MIEVNDSNFDKMVVESKLPVLVDFYAPWCAPCKMMAHVVDELAREYKDKYNVVKCNVDEADNVLTRYGIKNLPTFMTFKGGVTQEEYVGSTTKNELVKTLKMK